MQFKTKRLLPLVKPEIDTFVSIVLLLAVYVFTGWIGLSLGATNTFATFIWAPTGIALGAILLFGYRLWPGIFLAAFILNTWLGAPPLVAVCIALGNTLEAVVGTYLLSQFTELRFLFRRPRESLIFIVCAGVIALVSASIGVLSLALGGSLAQGGIFETWVPWWIGDTLGALVITPLVIIWFTQSTSEKTLHEPAKRLERVYAVAEFLLLCGILVGLNALTFADPFYIPDSIPLLYLATLPLAWSAIRFRPRTTIFMLFLNASIAIIATALGHGPFVTVPASQGLLFLQLYITTISITFLVFAAIVKERGDAVNSLQGYVDKLEQALQKVRSVDKAKTDFLAVLAHELRNPLASIVSSLELMRLPGVSPEDSENSFEIIRKQTKNMTGLLDDLLDISRISKQKIKLVKEVLDTRVILARALESVTSLIKTNNHIVEIEEADQPLWVLGDPLRLEQIFMNLLNNAAKYTPNGGKITVTTARRGDTVVVRVTDTGIGIPGNMLDRVFEPFLQVNKESPRGSAGLGIGLSLTQKLIELHKGSITAESAGLSKGSTFTVRLPAFTTLSPDETPPIQTGLGFEESEDMLSITPKTMKSFNILVVDDNVTAATGIGKLLSYKGHTVQLAHTGTDALTATALSKPDIVILDIGLPEMDGYAVAERLRKEQKTEALLIAVTGYGQEEDKAKAKMAGFDFHLTKPVSLSDLEMVFEKFL